MPCFPTFLNPYRFSSFEYVVYVVYIHIYIVYYCLKLQKEMSEVMVFSRGGLLMARPIKKIVAEVQDLIKKNRVCV